MTAGSKWNPIYWRASTSPNDFINNQAATIDGTQTIESGVLSRSNFYSSNNHNNRNVGNRIMSKIEVNTVEPQCGTTLTLGGCRTNSSFR